VEGLVEDEGFNHKLEYGSLWHEAEEAHAAGKDPYKALGRYRDKLRARYPGSEAAINKWAAIAREQFPAYLDHWRKHPETAGRKHLLQEEPFRVPYCLPSGRTVTLRGKWDAIFSQKGIYIQENKTKGDPDEEGITRTVDQDLQTVIYLIALYAKKKEDPPAMGSLKPWLEALRKSPIKGALYNVIRRPLADRYAIRQRKAETERDFIKRVGQQVRDNPERFFMRWKATITTRDIDRFRLECFDPILESLWDWWEWLAPDPFHPWKLMEKWRKSGVKLAPQHFRFPFGVYNPLGSGYRGDYFNLLTRGQTSGLTRTDNLFPELRQ